MIKFPQHLIRLAQQYDQETTKCDALLGELEDELSIYAHENGLIAEGNDVGEMLYQLLDSLPEAAKVIEGAKMSEWISVDDRLPSEGVSVLVHNSFGEIHTCRVPVIIGTNKTWEANTGEFIRPRITHWMPLPPFPQEDGDE